MRHKKLNLILTKDVTVFLPVTRIQYIWIKGAKSFVFTIYSHFKHVSKDNTPGGEKRILFCHKSFSDTISNYLSQVKRINNFWMEMTIQFPVSTTFQTRTRGNRNRPTWKEWVFLMQKLNDLRYISDKNDKKFISKAHIRAQKVTIQRRLLRLMSGCDTERDQSCHPKICLLGYRSF